jgi:putative inorganic carbon (hco3(-)) transporter
VKLLSLFLFIIWFVLIIWRKEWRLPGLVIALCLDISKIWFIFLPIDQSTSMSPLVLDLARATVIACILGWVWDWLKQRERLLIFRGAIPILAVAVISLIFSTQRTIAAVEVVRLCVLFALSMSTAALFKKNGPRKFIVYIAVVGGILGVLGLLEYVGRFHYWPNMIMAYYPRAQATFVDSNIYARFLDISIIWTAYLWHERRNWITVTPLTLQLAGLMVSFSRSGWLALVVVFLLWAFIRRDKDLLILGSVGGSLALVLATMSSQVRERIQSLFNNESIISSVIGQRSWVLKAGWEMFSEHPIKGIGLGNFEGYFKGHFMELLPSYGGVTRSHTTLVTIAAETGLLGLAALTYFVYAVIRTVKVVVKKQDSTAFCILLSLTVIFISSQAEGRLYEDPWLWIMVGWLQQKQEAFYNQDIKLGV